jgi:diguanylate cyclase (GGDEF)-like protein/PAS domain S-box-containing protein
VQVPPPAAALSSAPSSAAAAGTPNALLLLPIVLVLALAAVAAIWGGRARRRAALAEERVRDAERRLREAERRHRALVEDNGVGMWQVSPTGETLYVNAAMCELLEVETPQEVAGKSYDLFFTPESVAAIRRERALRDRGTVSSYEVELVGRRGGRRHLMMSGAPVFGEDGRLQSVIGTCLDITGRRRAEEEQRRHEAQLGHLADHDALTDLLNRRRFERELRLALARAGQQRAGGALLWCDIDHFKHVNDSLGHRTGDELLVKVAASLRDHVRSDEVLARLGGDEFAVLLPRAGAEEADRLAQRLLDAVRSITVKLGGKPVRTTISIGIVLFPEHGSTAEELLSRADLAMYEAKRDGRNRRRLFDGGHEWQERLSSEMAGAERLREALEGSGFELYLQPVVELRPARRTAGKGDGGDGDGGRGDGARFEALLRMRGPGGTVLEPAEFLGTAARFGMMREIDRWVLAAAIRLIAQEAASGREIHLDVNLSGDAFADPALLPWIEGAIAEAGIPARCLALEITETAAVTDLEQARRFIEALRRLGCQLAIDDFGVGYSSFYYLKHLPVDLLKIDGSFIHDLARNPVSQHLVRAIIDMARGLGIRSVAEYVEDEETLVWARRHGIDYAQGFHIGGPLPAREVLPSQRRPAAEDRDPGHPAQPPAASLPADG